MSAGVLPAAPPRWGRALAIAGAVHLAALAALASFARHPVPPSEPSVMMVELPPLAPPPPAVAQQVARTTPDQPAAATPEATPIEAPHLRTPIPDNAVVVPPKAAAPQQVAPSAPSAAAPRATSVAAPPAAAVSSRVPTADASIGDDPKARKAAANYFQVLMAYLARRKEYPAEARQARQQGIVTVRFTVDRGGNVSAEAIKRGSGFATLDAATLRLMRRVSPVPPIPASMGRDAITIALPIEYSLSTR